MTSLDPDELHRTAKLLLETGVAATLKQATELLHTLRIQIHVSAAAAETRSGQAACLTAVNTGHRAFLGGCTVVLDDDPTCTIAWAHGTHLSTAIELAGGTIVTAIDPLVPTIAIGNLSPTANDTVWATWDGWIAAAVDDPAARMAESEGLELAGVVAAALAVSEVFQARTGSALAMNRYIGVSLWRPDLPYDSPDAQGPPLQYLPTRFWLLGLGHLGQATAWNIGMLPYRNPGSVELWLMDFDAIVKANLGTSLLAADNDLGLAKTRLVSRRLESIGMQTHIVERRFGADLTVTADEPLVAIAGFDKAAPRAALGDAGFERIVDLGLGGGTAYNDILIHTFPAPTNPADAFKSHPAAPPDLSRYQESIEELVNAGIADEVNARCGMVALAGTTASASFVGAIAGAFGLADLLRSLHQGLDLDVFSIDLRSGQPTAAPSTPPRPRVHIAYDPM